MVKVRQETRQGPPYHDTDRPARPYHGVIITQKLTRPNQKQKLRGKEKRNRKEGSRCNPGRTKKSDMLNWEIAG